MDAIPAALPPFASPYAPPDEDLAVKFIAASARDDAADRRIDARARRLIEAIRAKIGGLGGIEDFLHAFSLSTKEGLALMVLAEALLRVPDAATADRLIEDKLAAGRWLDGEVKSTALLVSASPRASFIPPRPRKLFSTMSCAGSGSPRCARRRARRCGYSPRIL